MCRWENLSCNIKKNSNSISQYETRSNFTSHIARKKSQLQHICSSYLINCRGASQATPLSYGDLFRRQTYHHFFFVYVFTLILSSWVHKCQEPGPCSYIYVKRAISKGLLQFFFYFTHKVRNCGASAPTKRHASDP
jgi:hypothetical protein